MSRRSRWESQLFELKRADSQRLIEVEMQKQPERRVLPAIGNQSYLGPDLAKPADSEISDGKAVFLHPSGKLYDAQYRPTGASLEIPPLPSESVYSEYEDYEHALIEWKSNLRDILGALRLPRGLGSVLPRPNASSDDTGLGRPRSYSNSHSYAFGPRGASVSSAAMLTTLMPPEPEPDLYRSYDEYAAALERWAVLAAAVTALPPHPSQLSDLLGIPLLKVEERTQKVAEETKQWLAQVDAGRVTAIESLNLWAELSRESQEALRASVEHVSVTLNKHLERTGAAAPPLLGRLHGVFAHPRVHSTDIPDPPRYLRPLRRLDLTGPMIRESLDSPGEVNDKPVEFPMPQSFAGPINLQTVSDPAYRHELHVKEKLLTHQHRHDHLYAWYQPQLAAEVRQRWLDDAHAIVHRDDNVVSSLRHLLYVPLPVDLFVEFLNKEHSAFKMYSRLFTRRTIGDVLSIVNKVQDELSFAKLAKLFLLALESSEGGTVVASLNQFGDIRVIRNAATLASFYRLVPKDVEDVDAEVLTYLKQTFFSKPVDQLVRDAALRSFWRLIREPVAKHPAIALAIDNIVQTNIASTAMQLQTQLPSLLLGMRHRSKRVSSLCTFALLNVMRTQDKTLQAAIRADKAGLFHGLRAVVRCKFQHSRDNSTLVFRELLKPQWRDHMLLNYLDLNALYEDLSMTRKAPTGTHCTAAPLQEFLCTLLTTAVQSAQGPADLGKIVVVVQTKHELFRWLLQQVIGDAAEAPSHPTSVLLSGLLATFARHFNRLTLVGNTSYKPKAKPAIPIDYVLRLEKMELQRMLQFIVDTPTKPAANYTTRTNMLQCFRHLLLPRSTFEYFANELPFYQKLTSFCRETDDDFNRCAWALFSECLIYHRGVIQIVCKNNQLERFLSVIGPSLAPGMVRNSMYHINNFLSMTLDHGLPEHLREGADRDIEKFAKYFCKKNLFIKMHMICKKFCEKGVVGGPFVEIARFYHLLHIQPQLSRILREASKEEDYRVLLERLEKMFEKPQL